MFRRIGDWFRNFMIGRYGSDKLNQYLLILGVILMLVGILFGGRSPLASWCSMLGYLPLLWCIFRTYSRNIEARRQENAAVLNWIARRRDRQHRYYRCPKCRQTVRVPRGRGKINIRCPRCSERFIKNT